MVEIWRFLANYFQKKKPYVPVAGLFFVPQKGKNSPHKKDAG
jgi:hypothetical protein